MVVLTSEWPRKERTQGGWDRWWVAEFPPAPLRPRPPTVPNTFPLTCSMRDLLQIVAWVFLVGCAPPPSSKPARIGQVQQAIEKAGGVTNVLNVSSVLFARLSSETGSIVGWPTREITHFQGISEITNLGDVF